ncbi:acetate/propionate family kinase [Rickettsia endosymbiont of Halotydeus destructor]|uniref:acetate/propionate family kinase n=1 Tax=Rickettsia endosymbiont of Halotydeus destructor TaxID=2996754 RepID=UPI003BAF6B7F
MSDVLLVANAGSSSLKISVFAIQDKKIANRIYRIFLEKDDDEIIFHLNSKDKSERVLSKKITGDAVDMMIDIFAEWWNKQQELNLIATGHRVVHGGKNFNIPAIVTEKVSEQLKALIPLSPLHQPYNLEVLDLFRQKYPEVTHVACFDTSFHSTNPPLAKAFGLPKKYYEQGIYRYGFHGLSYKWVSCHFKEIVKEELPKRTIIGHLGSGSSMCALENGISIASSMGFSVLDGLMMGTRTGSIDPGVILYLLETEKMTVPQVTNLLYRQSGLLGVSGENSDVRELLESKTSDAKFAIELFVYRIQLEIGKLTAALGGLDCLIFTAGVGQNSPIIREMITDKLAWFGIKLDDKANQENNYLISSLDSKVKVYVIPTNEERVIAQDVMRFL